MAYIGRQPTVGNFRICDAISVVNGQAAYTMQVGGVNVIPESANNMIVSLNGVIQKPGSSYTVSSSTITFSSNLSTGDVIDFIQILGGVANIGTPSDGTVTSAKLSSGTINLSGGGFNIEDGYAYGFGDNSYRIEGKDDGANARIGFVTGGSEIARFTVDGLTFNGDTAAVNALDDYEEGTWTPVLTTSGNTDYTSVGYSIQYGHYTKIGHKVIVQCRVQTNSFTQGSPSGNIRISGLPFTSATNNIFDYAGSIGFSSHVNYNLSSFGTLSTGAVVNRGTANISITRTRSNNTADGVPATAITASGFDISITVTYIV